VASARFSPDTAPLLAVEPLARRLLVADPKQWFADEEERVQGIRAAFSSAVGSIVDSLGPDPSFWNWGRVHVMPLRHVLSTLGDGSIADLVNADPRPIGGDMTTLGNTGQGVFLAPSRPHTPTFCRVPTYT
jgi:acyl-homoserine lactone acylase PvdQ